MSENANRQDLSRWNRLASSIDRRTEKEAGPLAKEVDAFVAERGSSTPSASVDFGLRSIDQQAASMSPVRRLLVAAAGAEESPQKEYCYKSETICS